MMAEGSETMTAPEARLRDRIAGLMPAGPVRHAVLLGVVLVMNYATLSLAVGLYRHQALTDGRTPTAVQTAIAWPFSAFFMKDPVSARRR